MSISRVAANKLRPILSLWTQALRHSIEEHGVPNSFGVVELATEFHGLHRKDGYRLGNSRCPDLTDWLNCGAIHGVVVTYSKGRFHVSAR